MSVSLWKCKKCKKFVCLFVYRGSTFYGCFTFFFSFFWNIFEKKTNFLHKKRYKCERNFKHFLRYLLVAKNEQQQKTTYVEYDSETVSTYIVTRKMLSSMYCMCIYARDNHTSNFMLCICKIAAYQTQPKPH